MKYVNSFIKWGYEMNSNFRMSDEYKRGDFYVMSNNKAVVILNKITKKATYALCHPEDNFDMNVGIGIAYARYLGLEIPQEEKNSFLLKR